MKKLVSLLMLAGSTALAQGDVAVTRHSVRLDDGRTLAYTAQVGQLPIRSMESAEPRAHIAYISYRATPPSGAARRPIIFMWGGGPSGPSLSDNLTYGPKRIVEGKLVDNPLTILSVADLVFVDPVGTGFSRPAKPEYRADFYQVIGDQTSVAEFIRVWRNYHDLERAPIFLYGGSYGTWRVSGVADALERNGTRVTGAILKAGGIQLGAEALPAIYRAALQVPGRAVTALHHQKLSPEVGTTVGQVYANTYKWAIDTYVPALTRVASLTDAEREQIAQQLARYSAYPVDRIDRKTLVISRPDFLGNFLPGRTLNGNDMRNSSPAAPAGGRGGRGGRGAGGGGRGGAAPDDPSRITPVEYVRRVLNYKTDLAYLPNERGYVTTGVNYTAPGNGWKFNQVDSITPEMRAIVQVEGGPAGTQPWLKRAMEVNPRLQVLVAAGHFDSQNSCSGNEEMVKRQEPAIASRFTLKCYMSGHVLQGDPVVGPLFFADFRRWVTSTVNAR